METVTKTITALLLAAALGASHAENLRESDPQTWESAVAEVFNPLFEALQSGDVATIERLLDDELYEQYRVLLEQNSDYPQYLRDYYRGARFDLLEIEDQGHRYSALVEIEWPDGRRIPVRMRARSPKAAGHTPGR